MSIQEFTSKTSLLASDYESFYNLSKLSDAEKCKIIVIVIYSICI